MDKKTGLNKNIEYSKKNWAGYLQKFGKVLYTERIHYYYLYKFLKTLSLKKNMILVDIGFGSGYNIKKISKKYQIKTIGADIVDETVYKYNRQNIPNSSAVKIDPNNQHLPLANESADIVVCSHVLEHIPNDTILLKEIYRILKKKGTVYFNIPINEEHINVPLHVRKYTVSGFTELIKKYNFKVLERVESDIFTKYISYLGVHKNIINNILKKILILILSLFPIFFLEKISGKKSQFICIAKKL